MCFTLGRWFLHGFLGDVTGFSVKSSGFSAPRGQGSIEVTEFLLRFQLVRTATQQRVAMPRLIWQPGGVISRIGVCDQNGQEINGDSALYPIGNMVFYR